MWQVGDKVEVRRLVVNPDGEYTIAIEEGEIVGIYPAGHFMVRLANRQKHLVLPEQCRQIK